MSEKLTLDRKEEKTSSGVKELQEAMDNLEKDNFIDFRIDLDGTVSMGHYKSRQKLEPSGAGHKFKIKNVNGEGMTLHNVSYGWQRQVDLRDNQGQVYDTVTSNALGFDFEGKYKKASDVVQDGVDWLNVREKERS